MSSLCYKTTHMGSWPKQDEIREYNHLALPLSLNLPVTGESPALSGDPSSSPSISIASQESQTEEDDPRDAARKKS